MAAVQQQFARYARAADDHDYDAWAELFSADALFAFGSEECRGRDNIRQWLAERLGTGAGFHSIVNISVEADGDDRVRAGADFAYSRRSGPDWELSLVGRYSDVLVREDGAWRFLEHRILVR